MIAVIFDVLTRRPTFDGEVWYEVSVALLAQQGYVARATDRLVPDGAKETQTGGALDHDHIA